MLKLFMIIGALFGMLSVVAGSIGGHALESKLVKQLVPTGDIEELDSLEYLPLKNEIQHRVDTFETGTRYHVYCSLGMILVSLIGIISFRGKRLAVCSALAFLLGLILFSGSLYGLSYFGIDNLRYVTPFGGVTMIVAWILFLLTCIFFDYESEEYETE